MLHASLLLAAAALAPGTAAPADGPIVTKQFVKSVGGKSVEGSAEAVETVSSCPAQSFESSAERMVDGKKRVSRVKLCAKAGSTAESWIATLEQARAKLDAHTGISAEAKAKIGGDLQAEIDRLKAAK